MTECGAAPNELETNPLAFGLSWGRPLSRRFYSMSDRSLVLSLSAGGLLILGALAPAAEPLQNSNPVPAAVSETPAQGLTVLNKGSLGQNSESGRKKFEADVLQLKPDLALIYIGMNDVINDRFFTPLERYIENMTWMIQQARQAGIVPVLCTLHHCVEAEIYKHHPREKFGQETPNTKMDRYNAALRKLAAQHRVGLADFAAATARLAQSDFLSSDGVHLSPSGNRLLAGTFFDVIAPRLRGRERVVCYGDSLTYGFQNKGAGTAEGETYPAMLARLVSARATPRAGD